MEHLTRKAGPWAEWSLSEELALGEGSERRVGVGPSGPCAGLLQCMQGEGLQPPS